MTTSSGNSIEYFAAHAHSHFSGMDGMNEVSEMVARVVELGQPALALTDHGNMAGSVQLYKECRKAGIAPFPGEEFYLVRDVSDPDTKGTRYHIGMLALDSKGYEALTRLSTLSWQEDRFYYKPLIDLSDLSFLHEQGYSDHIAVTTGCYSSVVVQSLLDPVRGLQATGDKVHESVLRMIARWFPNTTYVELQNHGITWDEHGVDDLWIAEQLFDSAQRLGLPVIFGGDSHYIRPEQQPVHDLMKDICYFGAGEDAHFSGGPYHLLSESEVRQALPARMHDAVSNGFTDLLDRHSLKIEPLDNYKFQVPRMFKDADAKLRELAENGLEDRKGNDTPTSVDWTRLDHELDVISKMGMSNYFLLVREHITEWCRDNGIIVNTRGSANGSLVCYALGITEVDPMKWHTNFERFLSLDRMKPPDIDVDVDFRGRGRVIEHLRSVFPSMVQVGTYSAIGFGKPDEDGNETGSVIVQYMAAMRKKDPDFNGRVKPEHRQSLDKLAVTPVYKSMGTNAAGFILPGDGHPISQWLPLARVISSNTTVTQFAKDDVESMGYLKIDVLGLRALQTLNNTLVMIGRKPNEWDWIPANDKKSCALLRSGKTAGIFQYEGFTQGKGGREMKIKSTQDAIFGLALYRPALINGGQKDQYLANRGLPKAQQVRLHSIFDKVLDDTAGVPLYQEQIMQMLQTIGMVFSEYNELMTAIKASNGFIAGAAETFARLQPSFYDLCEDAGLSDAETDDAWGAVVGFTEYGFNRAHSTSYGLMAYRSAYLKAHYPMEFMVSLLSVWATDKDKTREYTAEARRLGFSIVKPDVNDSDLGWKPDPGRPNALRKGLLAIPGIGEKVADVVIAERDANGPYRSIQDFIDRLPARPVSGGRSWKSKGELTGVCRILYESNAFRSVGNQ